MGDGDFGLWERVSAVLAAPGCVAPEGAEERLRMYLEEVIVDSWLLDEHREWLRTAVPADRRVPFEAFDGDREVHPLVERGLAGVRAELLLRLAYSADALNVIEATLFVTDADQFTKIGPDSPWYVADRRAHRRLLANGTIKAATREEIERILNAPLRPKVETLSNTKERRLFTLIDDRQELELAAAESFYLDRRPQQFRQFNNCLRHLRRLNDAMRTTVELVEFNRLDRLFHTALCRSLGGDCEKLQVYLRQIFKLLNSCPQTPLMRDSAISEHEQIIAAFQQPESCGLTEAISVHLSASRLRRAPGYEGFVAETNAGYYGPKLRLLLFISLGVRPQEIDRRYSDFTLQPIAESLRAHDTEPAQLVYIQPPKALVDRWSRKLRNHFHLDFPDQLDVAYRDFHERLRMKLVELGDTWARADARVCCSMIRLLPDDNALFVSLARGETVGFFHYRDKGVKMTRRPGQQVGEKEVRTPPLMREPAKASERERLERIRMCAYESVEKLAAKDEAARRVHEALMDCMHAPQSA